MAVAHDGRSDQLHDTLAALALFADVPAAELEAIAHTMEERYFAEGERILRQGFSGSGFYIILEGEAAARVKDAEVNRLGRWRGGSAGWRDFRRNSGRQRPSW